MTEYIGKQYRLRAGSPMPTKHIGNFVVHTFYGQVETLTQAPCTDSLLESSEFKGQGGDYTSASFAKLPLTEERYKKNLSDDGDHVNEWEGGSFTSSDSVFIECESVSVQYNNMGIATVNFTIISNRPISESDIPSSIVLGNIHLSGAIYNVNSQPIPKTEGWYTTSVTLMTTG